MTTDPYRTAVREVTDADRNPAPAASPRVITMTEAMIAADDEARRRAMAGRLRYRLSDAAYAAWRDEVFTSAAAFKVEHAEPPVPPRVDQTPNECVHVGAFRGCQVFVDPEMIAGWTVEICNPDEGDAMTDNERDPIREAFAAGYFAGHDDAHRDSRVAFPDAAYDRWAAREAPAPDEARRQIGALADALALHCPGLKDDEPAFFATWAYELGARVR